MDMRQDGMRFKRFFFFAAALLIFSICLSGCGSGDSDNPISLGSPSGTGGATAGISGNPSGSAGSSTTLDNSYQGTITYPTAPGEVAGSASPDMINVSPTANTAIDGSVDVTITNKDLGTSTEITGYISPIPPGSDGKIYLSAVGSGYTISGGGNNPDSSLSGPGTVTNPDGTSGTFTLSVTPSGSLRS